MYSNLLLKGDPERQKAFAKELAINLKMNIFMYGFRKPVGY